MDKKTALPKIKKENLLKKYKHTSRIALLIMLTVFQLVSFFQVAVDKTDKINYEILFIMGGYILIEWLYFFVFSVFLKRKSFELETIAFLLTGIGLTIVASVNPADLLKQFIAVVLGLFTFIAMTFYMGSIKRIEVMRMPLGFCAVGILSLNLILAKAINGARNWISLGGISIQPSELVKIAFIFVGASTLAKLQSARSLTKFIVFFLFCVGALFLMYDFGTALIFFATFLIIAFMRSGDIRTLLIICGAALVGAGLILMFKPYVANRFATYRHVWELADAGGYQQTRVLIYSVSGGLFGVGIGNGKLRNIFASTTDLVFGVVCEEWGIILGFAIIVMFALLTVYAIRSAGATRSTFYSIASCAAAGMMLFQVCLNVFGITDLLPLTGVTLPFISQGGTSMICSWGLLAFIKSADNSTYPEIEREGKRI
ncbi:MAG: FtsW/RodA/SpoVE family cell cycle protein [Clostridiales bacterium]|nr:FtsW/RodA/SpoVE family cell cycle protein [Clostridiales bacterium]